MKNRIKKVVSVIGITFCITLIALYFAFKKLCREILQEEQEKHDEDLI